MMNDWQMMVGGSCANAGSKAKGDRSEFEHARDSKGELKKFAVFTSDVRVAPVTLAQEKLRSGART